MHLNYWHLRTLRTMANAYQLSFDIFAPKISTITYPKFFKAVSKTSLHCNLGKRSLSKCNFDCNNSFSVLFDFHEFSNFHRGTFFAPNDANFHVSWKILDLIEGLQPKWRQPKEMISKCAWNNFSIFNCLPYCRSFQGDVLCSVSSYNEDDTEDF